MKTIYNVITDTNTTCTTSKREFIHAIHIAEKNGQDYQVSRSIPTTNVRRLLSKGEHTVLVKADSGKTYTIIATNDPTIYGEKKRDTSRETAGKSLVYNVKAGTWQNLNVVGIHINGEWYDLTKVDANRPKRLSLTEALTRLAEAGYEVVKKGSKFIFTDTGVELERSGRDVVRFAASIHC